MNTTKKLDLKQKAAQVYSLCKELLCVYGNDETELDELDGVNDVIDEAANFVNAFQNSTACQTAIEVLSQKENLYVVSIEVRDAQAHFIPVSGDDGDDDNWHDIEGYVEFTRFRAKSKDEAFRKLQETYPQYDVNCFEIEEFVLK